jgi:chitinase
VNHPPVADAGADQSIAEGSPVTLHGENSFDIDNDVFTYAWTQVSGPAVTITGADTSGPTFTAPYAGTGGATGVVATLVFELLVDDGFPADAPATGYTLANVRDRVTVEITNTNNLPVANAGADQTLDEHSSVALTGVASSDPDSDTLTHAWTQAGGPAVTLTGGTTATPSFTAPFVSAGGADLTFSLTVDDGYGGTATDSVVIHVQNMNDPPLATAAQPTVALLWPPNHQMIAVGITGVSDPNNNATITITSVTQDEPTNGLGDGDTPIDAVIDADGTVLLRAERSGKGDGRVYRISFTASDLEGSASGMVKVVVPHSVKKPAVDSSGTLYDSTN